MLADVGQVVAIEEEVVVVEDGVALLGQVCTLSKNFLWAGRDRSFR